MYVYKRFRNCFLLCMKYLLIIEIQQGLKIYAWGGFHKRKIFLELIMWFIL